MTTAPAQEPRELSEPSDAELITHVREGSTEAYATLYARHRAAAYNLARQLARSTAEADDLVSEAFARLLDTLRSGGGPDAAFRAYLLTALRHCAYDRTRRDRKIELSDDVSAHDPGVPFTDTAVAGLERSLAARAFATLPERWQAVLWHTEIEGQSPAEVAPLLGLSPNGVSALAYRAREGLRQAYLQVHLADTAAAGGGGMTRCQAAVDRLGAWTRDGLSKRETAQVEQHLDECDRCRALAAELADVNGGLRVFVAPLVLGTATAGYLAACGKAAGVVVAGAAVAGAAGAGAGMVGASGTGGTGGAAGGAASGPRQFLTAAGSAVALAAAIMAALLAGPGEPAVPRAAAAPPPAAPNAPNPPPAQPPAQQPPPQQPPAQQPPAQQPPAQQPPGVRPPVPIPPLPGLPVLDVSTPTDPLELFAGGAPVSLPITVRNTGGGTSDPVVVRLNLPSGVTSTGSGTISRPGPAATRPQSAGSGFATLAQGDVSCTGGTGTIRCATARGLEPGEQVVFVFTLRAAPDAVGGQITGSVNAGGSIDIRLPVIRVVIRSSDGVSVHGGMNQFVPWHAYLHVTATNTGLGTGQVIVTIALPEHVVVHSLWSGCQPVDGGRGARCTATLAAGKHATWEMMVSAEAPVDSEAAVTAVLGTARDTTVIPIHLRPLLPCLLVCLAGE